MKTRLFTFAGMLRDAGLSISTGETLDALRAVLLTGVDRPILRDGLAATLLKDQADRPVFDAAFDRCFPLVGEHRRKAARPQPAGTGSAAGRHGTQRPSATRQPQEVRPQRPALGPRTPTDHERAQHQQLSRQRHLLDTPFQEMTQRDIEDCDALVADLARRFRAHLDRRHRNHRHGRLDIRRTLRRSISKGGVPIEPAFRRRRPGAPDLVGLCDCSHSVATATGFLIGVLHPAYEFFRRVRLFAFVDQAVPISIEGGTLVPHERLDLYARSDFGRVLVKFWERYESLLSRNTVVLILGDARNNRMPPRADILGRIHRAARHIAWLNPEPVARWNTGDSVMNIYRRHCDEVLVASTLRQLATALRRSVQTLA